MRTDMEYTSIYRPTSGDHEAGHFVWQDLGGAVVLSDWSGPRPDRTDDGPLIVIEHEPITIVCRGNDWKAGRLQFIVPVIVQRDGRRSTVWTQERTARAVNRLTSQGFALDEHLQSLHETVQELISLPRPPKGYSARELEQDNPHNQWMHGL